MMTNLLRILERDADLAGISEHVGAETLSPAATLIVLAGCLVFFTGVIIDIVMLARTASENRAIAAGQRRLTSRPWPWTKMGPMLLLVAVLNGTFVLLMSAIAQVYDELPLWLVLCSVVAQTVFFFGTVAISVGLLVRWGDGTWRDMFGVLRGKLRRDVVLGMLYYAAAIPPVAIVGVLWHAMLNAIGYDLGHQAAVTLLIDSSYPLWIQVYLGVLAVAVAPVAEEALFRGVALPFLSKRFGIRPAVLVVALVFAAVHMHLPSAIPLFVMALTFAMAYVRTGSLVVPVVMHAMFNGTTLVTILLLKTSPLFKLAE